MHAHILAKLKFTPSQVIEISGITARKLWYWVEKGFLTAQGKHKNTYFRYPQVLKALLINKAIAQGLRLPQAAQQAEREVREIVWPDLSDKESSRKGTSAPKKGTNAKATILALESKTSGLRNLQKRLPQGEYRVLTAHTAPSAVQLFKRYAVDLVITDFETLRGAGTRLLNKLKEIDPTVEIILLTEHSSKSNGVESIRGRAYDFLESDLHSALEKALQSRSAYLRSKRLIEKLGKSNST